MLVRKEFSYTQVFLRLGAILVIFGFAALIWFMNPVKSTVRSRSRATAAVARPVTLAPDDLNDPRLQERNHLVLPPLPATFGRQNPFSSLQQSEEPESLRE